MQIAPVLLQIGNGVRAEDFMGLEECVEFRSRLEAEQPQAGRAMDGHMTPEWRFALIHA